jgi:hypothetical protein
MRPMATPLREQFQDPALRAQVLQDALQILDAEVSSKSGLGGLAIKATFGLVKGVGAGFLHAVLDKLFDDFIAAFEEPYQHAIQAGKSPGALVEVEKAAVASRLLSVTDGRVKRSGNAAVAKAYEKLRPSAQKHVEDAAPRLAGLLDRHAKRS